MNPRAKRQHYDATGPGTLGKDSEAKITHFVCGQAKEERISGVRPLSQRKKKSSVKIIGVDPDRDRCILQYAKTGRKVGKAKNYVVEGIGPTERHFPRPTMDSRLWMK